MAEGPPKLREEYDEKSDIMRAWFSDKPIVRSEELVTALGNTVIHLDDENEVVMIETHEFSTLAARKEQISRSSFLADPNATDTCGNINYEIVDCADYSNSSSGTTSLLLSTAQVHAIEGRDGPLAEKTFLLCPRFRIGLAGPLDSENPKGFALKGSVDGAQMFSWDWFEVERPGFARKIQEGGELAFEIALRDGKHQIVMTELLSDISIRLKALSAPRDQLAFRINLKKGSVIHWPYLVDDKVVL